MNTPRGTFSLFRLPKANYIITPPVRDIFANVLSFLILGGRFVGGEA